MIAQNFSTLRVKNKNALIEPVYTNANFSREACHHA